MPDTGKYRLELVFLSGERKRFFLGKHLERTVFFHTFYIFEFFNAVLYRIEIRQHPAEPAFAYIGHPATIRFFSDGILNLFFGAHEENRTAGRHRLFNLFKINVEVGQRFVQVDNVNPFTCAEHVIFHCRVPPAFLMAEMTAVFQQVFEC